MHYLHVVFFWLILVSAIPVNAHSENSPNPKTPRQANDYHWVPGVIDIRSAISDGSHTPDALADLGHQRGLGILLLSDHERVAVEYGIFPLRKFFKYTKQLPSVETFGWDQYLDIIDTANHRHDDVLLIPGVESSPFYYWSGLPFSKTGLTLNNWERHLLVFGLQSVQDFADLPTIGKTPGLTWRNQPPALILFAGAILIGLILLRLKGLRSKTGIMITTLGLIGCIDAIHLGKSQYDQYHGDQKIAPYQEFIDHVTSRGGLTFWNHPGTNSGKRLLPPIQLNTPPYSEVVTESDNYTGIAVLSGEAFIDAEPGGRWDQTLEEYCVGRRQRPVWGIATADFHQDGRHGEHLGDYTTVFAIRSLNQQEVLEALERGRMYAVKGSQPNQDRLLKFALTDTSKVIRAISGEEIELSGERALIEISINASSGSAHPLTLKLIENGQIIVTITEETPVLRHLEIQPPSGRKNYYRLDISSDNCRILSNPIFTRPASTNPTAHNR